MASVPELVRQTKRYASFFSNPQYTQHIDYVSKNGQRKVKEETHWKKIKALGKGGFGAVYLEECVRGDEKGGLRAVKEVKRSADANYHRELEAIALFSFKQYRHCFVESFGWYESADSIFITMEYLPSGDLQNFLGSPIPEYEGQQIVSQVLEGLHFMHDNNFAHRDLKPANVLVVREVPEWWVKIADFGISKRATEGLTALRTMTGTPGFTAPELLGYGNSDERSDDTYTNAVDVWSTGVITLLILTGENYFKDLKRLGQYALGHIGFPLDLLQARSISESGCDFTKALIAVGPRDRPTVERSLQHTWISTLDKTGTDATLRASNLSGKPPSIPWSAESQSWPECSAQWSTQGGDSSMDAKPEAAINSSAPQSDREDCPFDYPPIAESSVTEREDAVDFVPETTALENAQIMYQWTGTKNLEGHSDSVLSVSFSPDGRLVASASKDNIVRLWEAETGTEIKKLEGHSNWVESVSFSPDGRLVASASEDKTVRLWEAETWAEIKKLEGHSNSVLSVAFSPDGRLVASASADKTVRLWEADTWVGTYDRTIRGKLKRLFR